MTTSNSNNNNIDNLDRILVAADFGGIGTKAIAYTSIDGEDKVLSIFMGSEIASVNSQAIDLLKTEPSDSPPEHRAWCGFNDSDYAVVGTLAVKFSGTTLLKPAKYELAVLKTLALFWVIKEKYKIPPHFAVDLGLLIPPGEYNDRFELEKLLMSACRGFQTPSGDMSVVINKFDCKPESAGIVTFLKNNPKYKFGQKNISVVMLGYRNASLIAFNLGQPIKKVSSLLGMNYMIEKFRDFTSDRTSLSKLVPLIVAAQNPESTDSSLGRLVSTQFFKNTDEQLERIKNGVKSSKGLYLKSLRDWLLESIPDDTDAVIFCGGTAEYLGEGLTDLSLNGVELSIFEGLKVPVKFDAYLLKERIYDLYCYYRFYLSTK